MLDEDDLMNDLSSIDTSSVNLFPELSSGDSAYSGSIKSEPNSPFNDSSIFPPSPSGSDHSGCSTNSVHDSTPPMSPNQSLNINQILNNPASDSNLKIMMAPDGSITVLNNQQNNIPTGQVQTFSGKLPIPKIKKPPPPQQSPIVLQLGTDGILYTKATTNPIIVKTEPSSIPVSSVSSCTSFCSPLITGQPTFTTAASADDLRNVKRQQRMIKNRESACISRKKKKEYVTTLEQELQQMSQQNNKLKIENESLKAKVRELESEKRLWTETLLSSSNGKKATAMFAVLFIVTLNMNSLSGIYNNMPSTIPKHQPLSKEGGRSLLWVEDDLDAIVENNSQNAHVENPEVGFTGNTSFSLPMCPNVVNQNESIRLESELRGWFNVDPTSPRSAKRPTSTTRPTLANSITSTTSTTPPSIPAPVIKSPLHSMTGSLYHMLIQEPSGRPVPGDKNAVSILGSPPKHTFASFFEAIDRRDDTFYVVSFSGDHLLVPATNHSQATRPRMSLLLPAVSVSLNDSRRGIPGTIAMMQIDCEVMNTQLLYVKQEAIPAHMAANLRTGNLSHKSENSSKSKTYETGPTSGSPSPYVRREFRNSEDTTQNNKDNLTIEGLIDQNEIPRFNKKFNTMQKEKHSKRRRKNGIK